MANKTYLLDTHCVIWFQENNPKIQKHVVELIQNPDNKVLFSQVSLFEIAIKQKIGKLPDFASSVNDIYNQAIKDDFTFLPVFNSHLYSYQKVPLKLDHRDPFDRLIIATALEENAVILTVDKNFELYRDIVSIEW